MADMATPSAAAMTTTDVKTNGDQSNGVKANGDKADKPDKIVRPDKPDEEAYKTELAAAEKELAACNERMKTIKSKLDLAKPNTDTPANARKNDLIKERNEIRTHQQSGKSSRTAVMDKIKRLDEQLKAAISDDKTARSKTKFKSADEVQVEIERLQKQVDAGTMKIVDEKKALNEVTTLNKLKKGFSSFDAANERIASLKSQIAELRKSLDDPESKAMSDRYTAIQTELDKLKADQDGVYKNLNGMRDERTKAHEAQNAAWEKVKAIKDGHYSAKRAYRDYENEAWKIKKAKRDEEQKAYLAGKKKAHAQERLEEASAPAYQAEIQAAEGLVYYLDSASATGQKATTAAPATTIEAPQGTRVVKRDDSDFMVLGGGKKKKGRQHQEKDKYQLSMGVIEQFAQVGMDPPISQADVPAKVEALKAKIAELKADQDRKTKENVAKAQKEIEELEAKMEAL